MDSGFGRQKKTRTVFAFNDRKQDKTRACFCFIYLHQSKKESMHFDTPYICEIRGSFVRKMPESTLTNSNASIPDSVYLISIPSY